MFDPKDYDSPQVKLTLEWRQAFDKKDPELIAKSLHKDYRRTTHPRSLGKPEQTREEWLEQITGFLNALAELEVGHISCLRTLFAMAKSLPQLSIHPVVDVPGKVTIHVRIPDVQVDAVST